MGLRRLNLIRNRRKEYISNFIISKDNLLFQKVPLLHQLHRRLIELVPQNNILVHHIEHPRLLQVRVPSLPHQGVMNRPDQLRHTHLLLKVHLSDYDRVLFCQFRPSNLDELLNVLIVQLRVPLSLPRRSIFNSLV